VPTQTEQSPTQTKQDQILTMQASILTIKVKTLTIQPRTTFPLISTQTNHTPTISGSPSPPSSTQTRSPFHPPIHPFQSPHPHFPAPSGANRKARTALSSYSIMQKSSQFHNFATQNIRHLPCVIHALLLTNNRISEKIHSSFTDGISSDKTIPR